MPTTTRTPAKRRVRKGAPEQVDVAATFTEWLALRRMEKLTAERVTGLRDQLMAVVEAQGRTDEHQHQFLPFSSPIVDEDGVKWAGLKRERAVTHIFDEEAAVALLKSKKLWPTREQLRVLEEIRAANPALTFTFAPDPDALLRLAYEGQRITPAEYDALFTDRVGYRFVPQRLR